MKKSILFLSIIFGLLISNPIKAQNATVNITETCKNWFNDIYEIVTEKGDFSGSTIIKNDKGLAEKIIWTKKTLIIEGVTFYRATQKFEKSGSSYTPDLSYFDALYNIRSSIYKQYKKGIYSQDFKK